MDHIRDNICGTFNREHLLSRQDILNIKRQYNVQGVEKHKDDQLSILAWVSELNALDCSPVLVFKPQGEDNDFSGIKKKTLLLEYKLLFSVT